MHLVVVPNGGWPIRADGQLNLPAKLISGLAAYAEHWPGRITLLTRGVPYDGFGPPNLGSLWTSSSDLPCEVVLTSDLSGRLAELAPDVVLASMEPGRGSLLSQPAPVVFVSEVPVAVRTEYLVRTTRSRVARARIRAGAVRLRRAEQQLVRDSAGLQCNGWTAWDALAYESPDPLLFFDTRLRNTHLPSAARVRHVDQPLRLAYSARHSPEKGPQFVLDLQAELHRRGVPSTTVLFGRGPLTEQLRVRAVSSVHFAGDVDFEDVWIPSVRDTIDVMVLPHLLGDPSGTYLESAGLGVPVLGFDNAALAAMVRESGAGWTVPIGDGSTLADRAEHLASHPSDVSAAADNGIAFMRNHPFEKEFARRVDHLAQVAQVGT